MHNRAILAALRAAAMVVIATGLNEVIAGAEPRYEPVYVYLVAVAVVTWLDGVLLGSLAAVFSAAFYAMLFMPREASWTMTRLTPAGAMLLAVIVAGALRALLRRKPRPEPPQAIFTATAQPLLAAPVEDHTEEVLAAIDELRSEFRAAISEVRMSAPAEPPPPDLRNELAAAQAAVKEQEKRAQAAAAEAALLRMEVDHVRQEGERAAKLGERVAELEAQLAKAVRDSDDRDLELRAERARTIAARAEMGALHEKLKELELARERIEAELRSESVRTEAARAETEALQAKLDELQVSIDGERTAFDEKLDKIVTHLASDHESDLGQAVAEREEARAEARMLKATMQLMARELEILRAREKEHAPPPRPRVLIAHPDADVRASAKASLDRTGYEVLTAADGLEALRMAASEHPNVVIADAIMPKMNGRELCQLLKSQEKTANIRVILLLRSTDAEPQGELVPDEVLRKPVPPETLRGTLAALLGTSAS